MTEAKKTGYQKAWQLLKDGQIELNKKGLPNIKILMEKAEISKAYAFGIRRKFLKEQKAREEQALPSDVSIEEVTVDKEKPPARKPEEPPEPEVERRERYTYEEVLKDLADFEDMLADGLNMGFGKEGIVPTVVNDSDYAQSEAKCKRLARNIVRYLRRRIDPETLEGYDIYILAFDGLMFGLYYPAVWLRKQREKKKKEKREKEE